jgi:tRNA (mo5U34)-methyltransferase
MSWYQTLELAPGLTTDGWFDNRPHVHHYGLPERMDGMRVLDVGTWDGFWAFEMERRGARVVALDVEHESEYDWPPRRRPARFADIRRGDGFRLAKEILGSGVERVHCNIYQALPENLGTFDLVFCGVVLVHLRDQLLALERFAGLCHGRLILAEEYDRPTSLLPIPVSPTGTRPWCSGCPRGEHGGAWSGPRGSTTSRRRRASGR